MVLARVSSLRPRCSRQDDPLEAVHAHVNLGASTDGVGRREDEGARLPQDRQTPVAADDHRSVSLRRGCGNDRAYRLQHLLLREVALLAPTRTGCVVGTVVFQAVNGHLLSRAYLFSTPF